MRGTAWIIKGCTTSSAIESLTCVRVGRAAHRVAVGGFIVYCEQTAIPPIIAIRAANLTACEVFNILKNAPHLMAAGLTLSTLKEDFASENSGTNATSGWTVTTKRKLLEY
jgi:hypothetical protein